MKQLKKMAFTSLENDVLSEMEMLQVYGGTSDGDTPNDRCTVNPGCIINAVAGCACTCGGNTGGTCGGNTGGTCGGNTGGTCGGNIGGTCGGNGNGNVVNVLANCRH